MFARDFIPSLPLQEFISRYRVRHLVFDKSFTPNCKPFPPRPEQCILFFPCGRETGDYTRDGVVIERPRSVIAGQVTQRVDRYASQPEFLMIEVDLKPGALHRLTGIAFTELTDKEIDAASFFNGEINRVNERLSSTRSYHDMIAIVELFFVGLIKKQKKALQPVDLVLNLVIENNHSYSVDQLAKNAFLSPRQLERKFDERIGINPKTFLRIVRFNESYWMKLKKPGLDWLSIAIACAYTDYQHLVRDYREFTNTTPNKFFAEEQQAPGRVLGLAK